MKVIGTAGHIDHGKSSLVHRLTGIDPDRLSEEKRRGMTIDLGFAWLTLPSGREVSIVDVPGHERFVKNMLAGAGGVDVALLVVAADEAVMPQTREHLDILDLLGVRYGVVALTKSDLVDADWLDLAREEVVEVLRGTTLEGSPVVPVSAVTGAGLADLLAALDESVSASPAPEDRGLPYLPIDRVFSVVGFGTVVTGTLHAGRLRVEDEIELVPGGLRGRIRTLQSHHRQVEEAGPGTRLAVNLTGIDRGHIDRGDVIARPATVSAVRRVAARVRVLADASVTLRSGLQVSAHLGAAEREATLSVLDGSSLQPGQTGWVHLRFDAPLPAVRGQRFILRLPAPARTVAGGEVVDVAPRHRWSDSRGRQRLEGLASQSLDEAALASLTSDRPRTLHQVAMELGIGEATAGERLQRLVASGGALQIAGSYLSAAGWQSIGERAQAALASYHASFPLRSGMPKEELRSRLRLDAALWPAALRRLADTGLVREHGSEVALPDHRGGVALRRAEANRVIDILSREPFSPPSGAELLAAARTDLALLAAMVEAGEIVRVADGLYFAAGAYRDATARIVETIRQEGEVTVAQVRDVLGTTRKYALSLLEHLDAERVTRRMGDTRVLGSRAPCA